jgi:hypothetical protein
MFGARDRPFYMSTQFLNLGPIPADEYANFISNHFSKAKRRIDPEGMTEILHFSRRHTYYTQALCNRLFATKNTTIDLSFVRQEAYLLVQEQEAIYYQYRQLLSDAQWQLLIAIALEEKVFQPTAAPFIQKHKLSASSTVQRSLQALESKEMIQWVETADAGFYQVYDCFLGRWLAWKYQNLYL